VCFDIEGELGCGKAGAIGVLGGVGGLCSWYVIFSGPIYLEDYGERRLTNCRELYPFHAHDCAEEEGYEGKGS
jgi:hypothetical protein